MTKTHKGLLLYIGWIGAGFALANLKVSMFGDGTIDWANWRFAWAMFLIGMLATCLAVAHAFYNRTAANEADELAALPPPATGPDLATQIRTAHVKGSPVSSAPQPPPADPPTPKA